MPSGIYCRDNRGVVHVVNPVNEEFTFCGNAWDGGIEGATTVRHGDFSSDPFAWERVNRGPVTCQQCASMIVVAKSARVSKRIKEQAE